MVVEPIPAGTWCLPQGLNITTAQFNALAEDLQTVLDKYNVPYRQQNRILALLAPLKRDVVTN